MIAITKYLSEADVAHLDPRTGRYIIGAGQAGSTAGKLTAKEREVIAAGEAVKADVAKRAAVVTQNTPVVTGAAAAAPEASAAAQPIPVPPAAQPIAQAAKKGGQKVIKQTVKEQPVGIQAPVKNQYIDDLTAKVKAGARAGGGEEAYQNAVKLNAAKQAVRGPAGVPIAAPVQTVQAVHPPVPRVVPVTAQPVQQAAAAQPVPVANAAKATQAADISGTQAAGIALQKGAHATGDALGSAAKKTAELAGEHPGMAGAAAGAIGLLGMRKLLNRNKQQS